MSTLYVVLGVPRNATSEEIRRAYKQVALQNHPDKTLSLHAAERLHREDIFKNARNAYEILSDSDKRRKYDLTLPRPPKPATVPTPKRSRTETRFPVNTTAAKNPEPRKPPFGRQPKPAGHTDKTKHPFSFFDNEEEHRKWKEAAYVPDPDEKTRANANASNTGGGEQNSAGDKRKDWNWGSSFAPEEAQRDDNANIRPSQSAGSSTFPQGEKQWNFFRQGPHGGHFHYMANSQRGKPRKTHNQHSTSDSTIYHAFEPMEANKTNPKQGNEGGYSSSTDHTQFGGSFFSKAAPHDTSFAEHRKEYMRSKAEDATTSLKREMDDYAERLRKTKCKRPNNRRPTLHRNDYTDHDPTTFGRDGYTSTPLNYDDDVIGSFASAEGGQSRKQASHGAGFSNNSAGAFSDPDLEREYQEMTSSLKDPAK